MRLATALFYVACLADGFAQSSTTLDAIRYPPLAAAARVRGDVLISGGKFISGPPLLAEAGLQGADLLNIRASGATVLIHFVLVDAIELTRTETIKKGDALDRLFLRLLRISTVKKRGIYECYENPNVPANRIDSTKDPIEVWVYGKARCAIAD
jgi:hypothetical protein